MLVGRKLLAQSKINNAHGGMQGGIDKHDIFKLQITVHDAFGMEVRHGLEKRRHDAVDLVFSIRISRIQISTTAELQNNKQLFLVLIGFNGTDNVRMIHVLEDFHLIAKFFDKLLT